MIIIALLIVKKETAIDIAMPITCCLFKPYFRPDMTVYKKKSWVSVALFNIALRLPLIHRACWHVQKGGGGA